MDGLPAWDAVAVRLAAELGEPVRCVEALGRSRPGRALWAAESDGEGALVVKARRGDLADVGTRWCAACLPLLGARGYPVPEIVWHGFLDLDWYVAVQRRLPGEPLRSLEPPLLDRLLELVELQADAGLDAAERDLPRTSPTSSSTAGTTCGATRRRRRFRPGA